MLHRRLRPGRPAWPFIYGNIGNTHELADIGALAFGACNGVHLIFAHNEKLKYVAAIQTSEFMDRHVISPPYYLESYH
jgi:hypothetical protein